MTSKAKCSSHLLGRLAGHVLLEAFQLLQRGDRGCGDAVRHGAQDVTELLVLLHQGLQLLHSLALLQNQHLHTRAEVLLLLKHTDTRLLLNAQGHAMFNLQSTLIDSE